MAYAKNSAWRPHVQASVTEIATRFKPSSVGTYPGHQPNMSLAADFMCSKAVGDAITAYAVANMQRLGIEYIIWYRQMYRSYVKNGVPIGKPAPYTGTSNPHTDHVHISWKATPGSGGAIINVGDIPKLVAGPIGGGLIDGAADTIGVAGQVIEIYQQLLKAAAWAQNRQNWINVLLILVGAWLILIALYRLAGSGVIKTVKAVSA